MEKLVMIPGPTPVTRDIQNEMGREIQAFGDPRFVSDYKSVIDGLCELLNCSGQTFVIAGSGTLAMEMAVANVTKLGDAILLISHGFFGERFMDICERKGLHVDVLRSEWGKIVPLDAIQTQLNEKTYATMIVTHVDTSTGVCAPLGEIGRLMKSFSETLLIVDGVCATAAEPENVDEMGIDILFSGTQKAFGVCPGLLMLWASQKALDRRRSLGTIPEYYVDFQNWLPIMEDPQKYFATPAINLVWALKESLAYINKEGIENRYQRHRIHARAVQSALEALGFGILADPEHRAVTLSNVVYPNGIEDAAFRKWLSEEGIIVAGGLGPTAGKLFRLGHMGNITQNELVLALAAIERTLDHFGSLSQYGLGVGTFLASLKGKQ